MEWKIASVVSELSFQIMIVLVGCILDLPSLERDWLSTFIQPTRSTMPRTFLLILHAGMKPSLKGKITTRRRAVWSVWLVDGMND